MPPLRIAIRIAADRMTAQVSVAAPLDPLSASASEAQLLEALSAAGVVNGIDRESVAELASHLSDPTFEARDLTVAAGRAAVPGAPGYVELFVETSLSPGTVDSDGHMDFFDRGLLKHIDDGALIGRSYAPTAGQPGVTVDGEILPAPCGAPAPLQIGSGLAMEADGAIRARRAGVLLHRGGELLDVVVEHVHEGPVDLHSGHLNMQGSLVVKGDVERLFQVRATDDLEVLGSVSSGSLSAGGSLRVSGNVRGGDDSKVVAGADAVIRACERASITARGTLQVHDAVTSELTARHVVVSGRLRGGSAVAEQSIKVKEAGTPNGATTRLRAGEPLEISRPEHVQRAVMMQKLRRMAERGGVRDAFGSRGEARGKGGRLGRLDSALSAEDLKHKAEQAALRLELGRTASVEVGVAHPGVELSIGSARLLIDRPAVGLRYALSRETGQLTASGRSTA